MEKKSVMMQSILQTNTNSNNDLKSTTRPSSTYDYEENDENSNENESEEDGSLAKLPVSLGPDAQSYHYSSSSSPALSPRTPSPSRPLLPATGSYLNDGKRQEWWPLINYVEFDGETGLHEIPSYDVDWPPRPASSSATFLNVLLTCFHRVCCCCFRLRDCCPPLYVNEHDKN